MSILNEEISHLDELLTSIAKKRENLILLGPLLEGLDEHWCRFENNIDFDHKPHATTIQIIRHFGGKWDKTPTSDGQITYTRREPIHGFIIRCYAGDPPPNCRIIEEEVEVPEQTIPARTETRKRLVCKEEASGNVQASGQYEEAKSAVDDIPF